MRITSLPLSVLILSCGTFAVGCSGSGSATDVPIVPGTGGINSAGGNVGSGGVGNLGGSSSGVSSSATGGTSLTSSTQSAGGTSSVGGTTASGGSPSNGGSVSTGGSVATGGKSTTGGSVATGGIAGGGSTSTGGSVATGGAATGGKTATGGASATGGSSTVSTGTIPDIDCTNLPAMPTGGTSHASSSQGGSNPLAWQVWSNGGSSGTVTIFSTPAFSATWNNSSNYLGRLGYEWGNSGAAYSSHGNIVAQFASKKSGSSNGSWSYVGMYGWTTNPCIEWYIVDDSFSTMPINPGNCANMSNSPLSIDGGKYTMCKRNTSGTGGDRCGGAGNWNQYYSIRQNNRTCGTISVSEHFKAWEAAGNSMAGNLLEVKILVEVGGGQGTVDFPIAKVTVDK